MADVDDMTGPGEAAPSSSVEPVDGGDPPTLRRFDVSPDVSSDEPPAPAPGWLDDALDTTIVRCDATGRVLELVGRGDLLPLPHDALLGRRVAELAGAAGWPDEAGAAWVAGLERLFDTLRPQIREYRFERDGAIREHEVRFLPIEAGQGLAIVRDVAERNRLRRQVEHLAWHDALTGLPNLRALRDRLARWFVPARGDGAATLLALVDLDRFKQTVDLEGRSAGDALLRVVAMRLRRSAWHALHDSPLATTLLPAGGETPDDDALVVARIAGDQFAVAVRLAADTAGADAWSTRVDAIAARLLSTLAEPARIAGQMLFARGSIGLALAPVDAPDPSTLYARAEAALGRAKRAGRNQACRHGDEREDPSLASMWSMPALKSLASRAASRPDAQALRAALSTEQFMLVWQPKFELASSLASNEGDADGDPDTVLAPGAVIAVEALLRWRAADGTLRLPHEFLPLAESSGAMAALGDWVLETALAEVASRARSVAPDVGIAINVSLSQLHDRTFVQTVERLLATHAMSPRRLTLEIAETSFLEDVRLVSDSLAELSASGVRIAIDHFGVGTAGLVALKTLPIDEIKIDRGFILGASIDAFDATIVRGLIAMAHDLGMKVTAEGVERVDQIASLSQMRCDAIQGYFIGEPLPVDALFALGRLWRRTRGPRP